MSFTIIEGNGGVANVPAGPSIMLNGSIGLATLTTFAAGDAFIAGGAGTLIPLRFGDGLATTTDFPQTEIQLYNSDRGSVAVADLLGAVSVSFVGVISCAMLETGDILCGAIDTQGQNVDAGAGFFIGDGSQLTNLPSGGGMAIGGTVTSGTAGRVLFVGAGPVLAEDSGLAFDGTTNTLTADRFAATQFGASASVSGADSVAVGPGAVSQATTPTGRGTAVGAGATISGSGSGEGTAVGYGATVSGGRFGTAVGASASATTSATAIGYGATASGANTVAIGKDAATSQSGSIVIGVSNTVSASNAVAIGLGNTSSAGLGIALGTANTAGHVGSVTFGNEMISARQRELAIGCGSGNGGGAWTGGHRIRIDSTTSTNALRTIGAIDWTWADATDSTRLSRFSVSVYSTTTAQEGLRVDANSGGVRLGFFGATAAAKPDVTGSRGGNAALASLLTALAGLGLLTDSSTA